MKTLQIPLITRGRLLTALSLGLAASMGITYAADKTWDGGGDQSSWSGSPANWNLDTDPVATDRLFFDGPVGLSPNNNFAANTVFSGIIFNSGAGAFNLSGNQVNLSGGVTNSSTTLQTISLTLNNNGANRDFVTLGDVDCYDVDGSKVVKSGAGTLTFLGTGDHNGTGVIINQGTVVLAKASGGSIHGIGSDSIVNTNGTLRIAGTGQDQVYFNANITLDGGVLQMQGTGLNEEIKMLRGTNLLSVVENGLAGTTNTLRVGGNRNNRAIYGGIIRDGAGSVLNFELRLRNVIQLLTGSNTYSGLTIVNNTDGSPATRLIVNGAHIGGGDYNVTGHASDATRQAALCGGGVISASAINLVGNALISPGGTLSDESNTATFSDTPSILTISNSVYLHTPTSSLDVQLNGTTAGTAYDQVYIAGTGSLSNNNANLRLTLGYTPQNGDTFTIVKVDGTDPARNVGVFANFNGAATDLSQGATFVEPNSGQNFQISYRAEGSTFDAGAGNGNNIMLRVVSSAGTNLTWRGDVNNQWDVTTTANWRNAGGTSLTFTNGDNVTFNDVGSNAAPIDLTGDVSPGNIVVNSTNNYTFATSGSGKLTGTVVLTKTNTGTLTILTDNDNVGSTLVRGGTLRIGTNGTSGFLSGALNVSTNGTVIFDRSDVFTNLSTITGSGRIINNGTNGTLIINADSAFNGSLIANAGTLQFGDGSGVTGSVLGRVTNNATVAYMFNNQAVINNSLSGTGRVNLINSTATSRKFILGGSPTSVTNTSFSGYFDVGPLVCLTTPDLSSGTNQLGIGSTVYVQDSGSIYLDRSGYYLSTFYLQGAGNGAGSAGTPVTMEIEGISPPTTVAGDVYALSSVTIGGFIGTSRISGRLLDTNGTSTITFANGRGPGTSFNLQLGSLSGPNHWGDTIIDPDLSGGVFTLTAMTPNAISTNSLTLGANGNFALNGNNHTVGRLLSTLPGGAVRNNHATTAAVLTVGADGNPSTFDGVFGNGGAAPLGVTKVGGGTLTLSGSSSNTGPVTVGGGSIALTGDGSFSNATQIVISSSATLDATARFDGNLNLNASQTLKGAGTLIGNLVTLPNSVINPGASIGTLTVSGNATLTGTLLLEVNRSVAPNADRLSVTGTLTTGGTLAVTNIGPALQVNDTFALFPTGTSGFTVSLPATDPLNAVSYTWQDNVAANGTVKVLSVTPITSPTLGVSRTGNTLNFSWTGPFKLQSQTNSLNVGLSSNWFSYPGGGTSPVSVTINPTNATVFFRLGLQ